MKDDKVMPSFQDLIKRKIVTKITDKIIVIKCQKCGAKWTPRNSKRLPTTCAECTQFPYTPRVGPGRPRKETVKQ